MGSWLDQDMLRKVQSWCRAVALGAKESQAGGVALELGVGQGWWL